MTDAAAWTQTFLLQGGGRPAPEAKKLRLKRPASASAVTRSHKASDDHVLSTHGINAVAVAVARRLDRGPWAVLEERRTVIVQQQQPPGADGVVRIPHLVGARLEKLRSEDEWIVIVETCHQCESHASWHRHDPQEYRNALEVVRIACSQLDGIDLSCCPLETPDLNQRIGAFEVFLLPPADAESPFSGYLLHSKLLTRQWPNQRSLVHRMRDDMPLLDRGWQRVLRLAADRQTQKLEAQMHRVASGAKKRTAELEQSLAETSELQREVGRLQVENHDLTKALADASEVAKVCQQQKLTAEEEQANLKESSMTAAVRADELQNEFWRVEVVKLAMEEELKALKASLQKMENQLQEKETMIRDFRLTAGQVAVAMQTTENTSQILQKELESARAERQELQSRVSTLQEEKWACTQEDAAGKDASGLREELGKTKCLLADAQHQLEELHRERDEAWKARQGPSEEERNDLEQQLGARQGRIDQLESELQQKAKDTDELQERLGTERGNWEEQKKDLQQEVDDRQGRLDDLESEVEQLKLQTKEQLAVRDKSWEEEKRDLEQQLDARQGRIDDLQSEVERLMLQTKEQLAARDRSGEEEKKELEQQLEARQGRIDQLEGDVEQLKLQTQEQLAARDKRWEVERKDLEQQLEARQGRIDQLEAEVKQVKLQTKEELAATDRSWEEEKKDLEQQLQARQGHIDQLEGDVEQLKLQTKEQEQLAARDKSWEVERKDLEQQLEARQGRIDQLEAEVKQVKLQTKEELVAATDGSWEEEKKDLEQQLQARQGRIDELEGDVEQLKLQTKEQLAARDKSWDAERQDLEQQLEARQGRIDQLEADVEQAKLQTQEKKDLEQQLESRQGRIDQLESEVEQLKLQTTDQVAAPDKSWGEEKKDLEQQLEARQGRIDQLQTDVEQLKAQMQEAQERSWEEEKQGLLQQLEARQGRIDQLETEVEKLKLRTKDAPERSWEEEKKDLEQQLNARQGQTVRTDFSSHVFSKESEKCDFVDKATHSPRVVDYRFVADPSFIGPKPALQGQLAAPQALEEAQREQATPAQGTQGTGTDDVSSCGMVQRERQPEPERDQRGMPNLRPKQEHN
ncbi:unnamed protein product [Durusdinium trenchii]|uniref:Uncharacterized protein n=1 Tax=Durusdinium trenchii TaxID=1381693 RepID=A0ABP0NFZ8_9DINO